MERYKVKVDAELGRECCKWLFVIRAKRERATVSAKVRNSGRRGQTLSLSQRERETQRSAEASLLSQNSASTRSKA